MNFIRITVKDQDFRKTSKNEPGEGVTEQNLQATNIFLISLCILVWVVLMGIFWPYFKPTESPKIEQVYTCYQRDPITLKTFYVEGNRKVDRTYNTNLGLVIRYGRFNSVDIYTYSIHFYYSREDYVAWTYNSEAARDEAFEILERQIYGYEQELDFDVDYSKQ